MKKIFVITLIAFSIMLLKAEVGLTSIHPGIMLDAKFYSGEGSNDGLYDTSNRYQVRKAALELAGSFAENIEYSLEFGASTCSGSGLTLQVMDAAITYNFNDYLNLSLMQGHIIRGFAATTECSARLSMEKPLFYTTFAVCHPTGLVANSFIPAGETAGMEIELALMNGANSTLDGEHDYQIGTIFYTPIAGLALTANYNLSAKNYYFQDISGYKSKDGYRAVLGAEYQENRVWATAEFFSGKGFQNHDQEMQAWYAQLGYALPCSWESLEYIQPYFMYTAWDKHSENEVETEYTYADFGLNFSLDKSTKVKFAYHKPLDSPEADKDEIESFIARLQFIL